jgi:DNA polymerase III delta subunit
VLSFTDALAAGERAEAAEAAAGMTRDETGQALGVLARKLSQLELLHEARTKGMDAREVAAKLKLDRYVQHALREHVPAYGPDRVRHCRKLLAEAESAWRSGADSGVAEALAALW